MFDISKLNKSSFRGVPFYTKDDELSGGQRLTDHSFINGGTLTESNGIKNNTFKINGYIGGDDYLAQKKALIEVLENIESGTLVDKFHGKVDVFVDTWSLKESISRIGIAEIGITFKKASNKLQKTREVLYSVDARDASLSDFKQSFNPAIGEELRTKIVDDIIEMYGKLQDGIKFLEDTRDFSQNIKSKVGNTIATIKGDIIYVDSLANEIVSIWTSFDEVTDLGMFDSVAQKNYTSTLRDMAVSNNSRVSSNKAELKAQEQSKIYQNCVILGMTHTAIKNLETINFITGDDFGSCKDDILEVMRILEKEITNSDNIDDTVSKQELLNKYQESRKEFISFYTSMFSKLQGLETDTIVLSTNIFEYTIEKYSDINRADEILDNNSIVDPIFIDGDLLVLSR